MSYTLTLKFYDHSLNLSTSSSTSSESYSNPPHPLLPKTKTLLPNQLDSKLRSIQSKLCLPLNFWSTLPISRKLDKNSLNLVHNNSHNKVEEVPSNRIWSETKGEITSPNIATSDLYLSSSNQIATLDYRFGPLTIDWIDNPQPLTPLSPPTSPIMSSAPSGSGSGSGGGKNLPKLKPIETSGITELFYGTLHLHTTRGGGGGDSKSKQVNPTKDVDQVVDDGTILGMISVPRNFTAAQLLRFIQPALESISQIRMLKDSNPNRMMVILKFKTQADAREFKFIYNSKLYHPDSNESEACQVISISEIKLTSVTSTPPYTFPYSPTELESSQSASASGSGSGTTKNDLVELPTCAVCLERMDNSVTGGGLIQILCTHAFHCNCLLKWGDSTCPICRATNYRTNLNRTVSTEAGTSQCTICRSDSNLWICMICGVLGCGRYQGGHAHSHFIESNHSFALELETQRIWDYDGDAYVHRLIQSRTDGKLVELPSSHSSLTSKNNEEKTSTKGGPDEKDEASMDKIEAMGSQYGVIMTNALEEQRHYFLEELGKSREESLDLKSKWRESLDLLEGVRKERLQEKEWVKKLEKEKENLKIKMDYEFKKGVEEEIIRKKERLEAHKTKKEIEKALIEEKAVTTSLTENLRHLTLEMEQRNQEIQSVKLEIEEMKDSMRDVMFALSARDQIEQAGGEGELVGGDISVPVPPPTTTSSSSNSRRKKKK